MNPVRHRGRRLAVSALYDGAFKLRINATGNTFALPCSGSGYNAVVDWGDGKSEIISGTPGSVSHTYGSTGPYVVSIKERVPGGFPLIYFNNGGDKLKVIDIVQFGRNKWTALNAAFHGCANLKISATDAAGANTRAVTSMANMFRDCTSLVEIPWFDTSLVNTFSSVCNNCQSLKKFPKFNAALVTTVNNAWFNTIAMTDFPAIDLPVCTDFTSAWYLAALTSFPFIDVSSGTTFTSTWRSCTGMNGYAFPDLDLHNMNAGAYILGSVNFSKAAYNSMLDQLVNGRGAIPANANNSVAFYVGAHYDNSTGGYNGTAARATLTGAPRSWGIADGGTP